MNGSHATAADSTHGINDHGDTRWFAVRGVIAGALILALASGFATWAVFRQFGGYDLSPLVDLFWRMHSGAVPGVDFISTWPPLILLTAKGFAMLDWGWYELTAANIAVAYATFAALMALLPRADRSTALCSGLAIAVAIPLVYTNHIWHSSLSQYCAAIFFVALFAGLEERPWARRDAVSLIVTSALIALAKQNVALPVLAAALPFSLIFGGERRWKLLLAIGIGSAIGILAAILLLPISPTDFLATYTAVAGRGLPSREMLAAIVGGPTNLPAVGLCLGAVAIALISIEKGRLPLRQRLLAGLFALLSLIPIATDWDAKLNDVTWPLIIALIAARKVKSVPGNVVNARIIKTMALGILFIAVVGGARRERMASVGEGAFWEPIATNRIKDGYFAGLYTGNIMLRVLQEMEQVGISRPHKRLFFGPRLEFGYKVLSVPSPEGMPLWWHPGSSYALRDEPRIIKAFAKGRIDTLVFLGGDRTRMPAALLTYIGQHYRLTSRVGALQVFDRIDQLRGDEIS
jgi:hypothetical protein